MNIEHRRTFNPRDKVDLGAVFRAGQAIDLMDLACALGAAPGWTLQSRTRLNDAVVHYFDPGRQQATTLTKRDLEMPASSRGSETEGAADIHGLDVDEPREFLVHGQRLQKFRASQMGRTGRISIEMTAVRGMRDAISSVSSQSLASTM